MESMTSLQDQLRELLRKYQWMRKARRASRQPTSSASGPSRTELRQLAERFPGVLAELDRIGDELLEERCQLLEEIVADERFVTRIEHTESTATCAELPSWVRGWLHVHGALRGALICKRWLGGARVVTPATRRQLLDEIDNGSVAVDARAWVERLSEVANPPHGRLLDVVFKDTARLLGIEPSGVRELLMPRPQREAPTGSRSGG